eukprot:15364356-Heterocapsa_arctica.AAC.1
MLPPSAHSFDEHDPHGWPVLEFVAVGAILVAPGVQDHVPEHIVRQGLVPLLFELAVDCSMRDPTVFVVPFQLEPVSRLLLLSLGPM